MRSRLHINGVIVNEIRPIDFAHALTQLIAEIDKAGEVSSEDWDSALFTGTELISGAITEEAKQAFIKLNACFFVTPTSHTHATTQTDGIKRALLPKIATDLQHRCSNLIERGHRDCWQYGWSYFLLVESRFKES